MSVTGRVLVMCAIVGSAVGCALRPLEWPRRPVPSAATPAPLSSSSSEAPTPASQTASAAGTAQTQSVSIWVPAAWSDLPGWAPASLDSVWPVLLRNCEQATTAVELPCSDIRRLAIADDGVRRTWMQERLRPYQLQTESGLSDGLLTAYYEPVFEATRTQQPGFNVPLYYPPAELVSGAKRQAPWWTREEIETRPDVQAKLKPLAWLADPVDALVLHIQGSGRLRFKDPKVAQASEGPAAAGERAVTQETEVAEVAVRFAASNNQPYRSVGRALLDARELTDASWPGIQAWLARHPHKVQSTLWRNPRYVFFMDAPIREPELGPPGAQGIALTAMRSIAVDPRSVPYGSLIWLHTKGPELNLSQLVVAQDTGAAIVGAVRADLFVGTGPQAGALAGRVKQPLWMWVLRPR